MSDESPPEDARDALRRSRGQAPATCAVGPCTAPRLPGSSYCGKHGPADAPDSAASSRTAPWKIWLGILVFLGIWFGGCAALIAAGSSDSAEDERNSARYGCHDLVESRLKAPGTADFEDINDAVITGDNGTYTVRGWVDAENTFGGEIRTTYTCTVRSQGDKWILVSLNTVP